MRAAAVLPALVAVPFLLGAAAAPADQSRVVFRFQDPAITESSGLVAQDGLFATVNDSGDSGRVFTVDEQGATVGVTSWAGEAYDLEALAPAGDGAVWVGDLGDNRRVRQSVRVSRVPIGRGDRSIEPASYELSYPDGARDAETLLADPDSGRLYVVTKGVLGGEVYAAPPRLSEGVNRLRPVAAGMPPLATDGAVLPDGRHALVRNYTHAVLYTFPDFGRVTSWRLPDQEQGESLAVDVRTRVYAGSEGVHAPVLWLRLPADVRAAIAPAEPAEPAPAEAPAHESDEVTTRDPWPWLLGGGVLVAMVVILLRSLRPR